MSICYRTDGRRAAVRMKGPPSPVPDSEASSTMSSKRKLQSNGSVSTRSSLQSVYSDPEKDKKSCPQSTKPLPSQQRRVNAKLMSPRPCRPGTKPQPPKEHDGGNAPNNDIAIKNSLEQKRREFSNLRTELMQKQNTFIEKLAQLRDLEGRSGVPVDIAGEVRLLSVKEWPVHDLLLLVQNTLAQPHTEMKGVLGPKILQQLRCQLTAIPEEVTALANELMERRFELLEYIRSVLHNDRLTYEGKKLEWQVKNNELDEETEKLRKLVLTTVKSFEAKIIHGLDVAKIPWIDRDNMIKKIESLQKELSIYKTKKPNVRGNIATAETQVENPSTTDTETNTTTESLQSLAPEQRYSKDRAARTAMKEAAAVAETKLATARARCAELERQLHDTKMELSSAQRRLDNLKQLHHFRASNYETHSKKLEKVSKTGEVTIEALSRQRDALELRVRELQEQATAKSRDAETRENLLTSRIESLKLKLEEQETRKQSLEEQVQESENRYKELKEQWKVLQERSREFINLQTQKCIEYLPRKVQCSGEELEIWNDLQATKDTLNRVKEELELSRADKDGLLNSLAKIAHEGPENKMAEELLSREQKINIMRNQIEELMENKRIMEENIACYENQLAALRVEVSVLRSVNTYESYIQELPHEKLQREVFNLCLQVESLTRERAALMTELTTRALLLERHERCAELFVQVTRARRDLVAQLEGNRAHSVLEGAPYHEVAETVAKAYLSSADLWSALHVERSRVLRLETTVLAQNRALERECAVRVEHERKRSQLERELISTWAGSNKCIKREMEVEMDDML